MTELNENKDLLMKNQKIKSTPTCPVLNYLSLSLSPTHIHTHILSGHMSRIWCHLHFTFSSHLSTFLCHLGLLSLSLSLTFFRLSILTSTLTLHHWNDSQWNLALFWNHLISPHSSQVHHLFVSLSLALFRFRSRCYYSLPVFLCIVIPTQFNLLSLFPVSLSSFFTRLCVHHENNLSITHRHSSLSLSLSSLSPLYF